MAPARRGPWTVSRGRRPVVSAWWPDRVGGGRRRLGGLAPVYSRNAGHRRRRGRARPSLDLSGNVSWIYPCCPRKCGPAPSGLSGPSGRDRAGVPAEHAAARFPALRDRRLPYRRRHRSDARVGSPPGQRGPGAGCAQVHPVSMPGPCGAFAPATGRQVDHGRRAAVSQPQPAVLKIRRPEVPGTPTAREPGTQDQVRDVLCAADVQSRYLSPDSRPPSCSLAGRSARNGTFPPQ